MRASAQRLMQGVFDYAGLFPPAALPIEEAAREWGGLQEGPTAWAVSRFVCPIGWLDDLLPHLYGTTDSPDRLTVLGTSLEGFKQDLALIERFEERAQGKAAVENYEVRATVGDLSPARLKPLAVSSFDECYVELPWNESLIEGVHLLAEQEVLGAKLRTGGIEAAAVPSVSALAGAIQECCNLDLPLKLTAGLHRALRGRDDHLGTDTHGFLNVLATCVLATPHDLTRSEIEVLLAENDPHAFWFTDSGFGWRDYEADLDEIADGREILRALGTCSVSEPMAGLADLLQGAQA